MKVTKNNMTIELKDEDEIITFWNIICFALDYNAEANRMTDAELKMAKYLRDQTEPTYHL